MTDESCRIIGLKVDNFKRLVAVDVRLEDGLVPIVGRNGAGKSSLLDAVLAALCGKDAAPPRPVRKGAETATIRLDLGAYRVTRQFEADGSSKLVVQTPNGHPYKNGQTILDELIGEHAIDPDIIQKMKSKELAQVLREVAGLDTSLIDNEYRTAFDERTRINREVKAMTAQCAALPLHEDAPDEPVSTAELAKRHRAASEAITANDRKRRTANTAKGEVDRLESDIRRLRTELEQAETKRSDALGRSAALAAEIATLADPDLTEIEAAMESAEAVNAKVAANRRRKEKDAALADVAAKARALTERLEMLQGQKAEMLAAAKFPIEGLGVDGDEITLNGLPLEQASSTERLEIVLEILAARNPKFRSLIIRDGSLLDSAHKAKAAEWAINRRMQVLMELASDDGNSRGGLVIEDGAVVSEPEPANA